MKRLSTILLVTALAIPSFAQLSGDGFYRLQNTSSKRYATIADNKANKKQVTSTSNADLYALNTKEGFNSIVSDPGSIIYFEKNGDNGYIMRGQGMDTYKLSGLYIKFNDSRTAAGAYWASVTYQGVAKYLHEAYEETFGFWYLTSATKNSDGTSRTKDWDIIPVTQEEGKYFGVKPDIEVGGKKYTTLYTSFAYQLSSGMKAYYVKQCNGDIAELTEIEGGIIPEATPVIIECISNNTADNILTPLNNSSTGNFQNKLQGIYFCNVIKWAMDGEEEFEHPNWNTTNYDAATMRVLGDVNGKLGFVKADDLKYLPANKAYLPVAESASASIELVDAETYATVGISEITTEKTTNNNGIYSLTGNKVEGKDNLPNGVYVINGKKAILRK